jgi:hypothetical protein
MNGTVSQKTGLSRFASIFPSCITVRTTAMVIQLTERVYTTEASLSLSIYVRTNYGTGSVSATE